MHLSKHIHDYQKKTNRNLANQRKHNFYKRWRHELRHRSPPVKIAPGPLPFNPALHTSIAYQVAVALRFLSIDQCWVCVCRALSLSVLYSVDLQYNVWRALALPSKQKNCLWTSRRKLCAFSKNPIFLRSQVISNYEFKIVHNCLEQAVTLLMYHSKYINKFVFLPRKSAFRS